MCEALLRAGANPRMTLELGRVLTALHVQALPTQLKFFLTEARRPNIARL